uniref:Uncharacterized protein n=1 Tax=Cacopsylla melanoneura TaxID=428564 RepID=A0A8D8TR01_9HEMI
MLRDFIPSFKSSLSSSSSTTPFPSSFFPCLGVTSFPNSSHLFNTCQEIPKHISPIARGSLPYKVSHLTPLFSRVFLKLLSFYISLPSPLSSLLFCLLLFTSSFPSFRIYSLFYFLCIFFPFPFQM